jgi:uncharacterized NAD(P)/FAD-binding protein YdhS
MNSQHVVVVGGGFSGALTALHLLAERDGPKVTLVERTGVFGLGAAYATNNPEHLLNTRAGNMSAFPDRPDHFLRWLMDRSDDQAIGRMTFMPRMTYGEYIQELLAEASESGRATGRLRLVTDDAIAVERGDGGFAVALAGGETLAADAMVLALGNLQPMQPPVKDASVLASDRYVAEAWRFDLAGKVAPDDAVFLLGTGLTMVDVVVALNARGHHGPFFALSRRGLLPRPHVEAPPKKHSPPELAQTLSGSLRTLRRLSGGDTDWRTVFDGLRPVTRDLWRTMPAKARARFLRHMRPWYDVHRHRLAPEVASRVQAMLDSGQLTIAAGRLDEIRTAPDGFEIAWRPRGGETGRTDRAAWVVNCIGPHADIRRAGEPLLDGLLGDGLASPDPLRLGLAVDLDSRLIDADGEVHDDLVAIGPLTRSAFWESTAVPDIRVQVAEVTRRLLAHLGAAAPTDAERYQAAGI